MHVDTDSDADATYPGIEELGDVLDVSPLFSSRFPTHLRIYCGHVILFLLLRKLFYGAPQHPRAAVSPSSPPLRAILPFIFVILVLFFYMSQMERVTVPTGSVIFPSLSSHPIYLFPLIYPRL
jgi:hypothetical protein